MFIKPEKIFFLLLSVLICLARPIFADRNLYSTKSLRELNVDWELLTGDEIISLQKHTIKNERKKNLILLRKAKLLIIKGDLNKSEFLLNKITPRVKKIQLIKKKYLAILEFIRGNFVRSLDLISDDLFKTSSAYRTICPLKIINRMALKDIYALEREVNTCQKATYKYSKNEQFWLTNLMTIKTNPENIHANNTLAEARFFWRNKEFVRIWLKTALFLGKEIPILRLIKELPKVYYNSKRIRGLIGLLYYRVGEYKKAQEFIEDIDSPNAENIKGNIFLRKKEYELAYGHYKLALKRKENSKNALERSIPLTWLLKEWEEGVNLLHKVTNIGKDSKSKFSLNTAFKIRQEKFKQAEKQLYILNEEFAGKAPLEIQQMKSYVAVRRYDLKEMIKASSKSCKDFDGLNCWILLNSLTWDNIGKTIEKKDKIIHSKNFDLTQITSSLEYSPLLESRIIDQKDIEELDDNELGIDLYKD